MYEATFITGLNRPNKKKIKYTSPLLDGVRKQHEQLMHIVEAFNSKVNHMVERQRYEYMQTYEEHMFDVQKELHALREKVTEIANDKTREEKIQQLRQDREFLRRQTLNLDAEASELRLKIRKIKDVVQTDEKERDWLIKTLRMEKLKFRRIQTDFAPSAAFESNASVGSSNENDSYYLEVERDGANKSQQQVETISRSQSEAVDLISSKTRLSTKTSQSRIHQDYAATSSCRNNGIATSTLPLLIDISTKKSSDPLHLFLRSSPLPHTTATITITTAGATVVKTPQQLSISHASANAITGVGSGKNLLSPQVPSRTSSARDFIPSLPSTAAATAAAAVSVKKHSESSSSLLALAMHSGIDLRDASRTHTSRLPSAAADGMGGKNFPPWSSSRGNTSTSRLHTGSEKDERAALAELVALRLKQDAVKEFIRQCSQACLAGAFGKVPKKALPELIAACKEVVEEERLLGEDEFVTLARIEEVGEDSIGEGVDTDEQMYRREKTETRRLELARKLAAIPAVFDLISELFFNQGDAFNEDYRSGDSGAEDSSIYGDDVGSLGYQYQPFSREGDVEQVDYQSQREIYAREETVSPNHDPFGGWADPNGKSSRALDHPLAGEWKSLDLMSIEARERSPFLGFSPSTSRRNSTENSPVSAMMTNFHLGKSSSLPALGGNRAPKKKGVKAKPDNSSDIGQRITPSISSMLNNRKPMLTKNFLDKDLVSYLQAGRQSRLQLQEKIKAQTSTLQDIDFDASDEDDF